MLGRITLCLPAQCISGMKSETPGSGRYFPTAAWPCSGWAFSRVPQTVCFHPCLFQLSLKPLMISTTLLLPQNSPMPHPLLGASHPSAHWDRCSLHMGKHGWGFQITVLILMKLLQVPRISF